MNKLLLSQILCCCILGGYAQGLTFQNTVGIGLNTVSSIPLHVNLNGPGGEIARFQGTNPYLTFYNGTNINGYLQAIGSTLEIGTKNNYNLTFYTGDAARFSIVGTTGQAIAYQKFNAFNGLSLSGGLELDGLQGNLGQVLTSGGSGTPTWTTLNTNPQIGFQVYPASNINCPHSSETNLTGFVEFFDDGSNFNPTTGVFTAPSSGLYCFQASLLVSASSNVDMQTFTRLFINNVFHQQNAIQAKIFDTSRDHALSSTFFVKLNANDTVRFAFLQFNSASSALTLVSYGGQRAITGYKVY